MSPSHDSVVASVAVASAALVALGAWHWQLVASTSGSSDDTDLAAAASAMPAELAPWLDQASYEVAAAICHALIPPHAVGPQNSTIQSHGSEEAAELYGALLRMAGVRSDPLQAQLIALHVPLGSSAATHVRRGAVAEQPAVHHDVTKAMNTLLLPEDKQQVALFLKALSTSAGALLLTGYPVPFQVRLAPRAGGKWCMTLTLCPSTLPCLAISAPAAGKAHHGASPPAGKCTDAAPPEEGEAWWSPPLTPTPPHHPPPVPPVQPPPAHPRRLFGF